MRNRVANVLLLVTATAALAACGGGSSSGSPQSNPGVNPGSGLVLVQFSGNAAKGPLRNAQMDIFQADNNGNRTQPTPLVSTTTDALGNWSTSVMTTTDAHIVQSDGGIYTDESDSNPNPALKREIQLGAGETFEALIPANESTATLNIFTNALLVKSRNESFSGNFQLVFANNRTLYQQAFGIDVVGTLPTDPVTPDPASTEAERQYAMALGGLANVLNDVAVRFGKPVPDYAMMQALVADLSDCQLDGSDINGQVLVNVDGIDQPFPNDIDLNIEITRFRNNNINQYQNTPLIQIDEAGCSQSGAPPDTVAPSFTAVPAAFTVAAVDASGTPASDPVIQGNLNSATAVDDRPGPVNISNDAPAVFPLGETLVTFTATDGAGNQGIATVRVTIEDQATPQITAPNDVVTVTTGPLTTVNLGQPVFSDNVTPVGLLVVTNDAPPAGFPVGIHIVTWTVMDEAGLIATDQQQVTVHTPNAPVVVIPIPDAAATEGVPLVINVSANFNDADGDPLSYAMQGLPGGSGMSFDSNTGVLSGIPNDTDAKASPLTLTVTASDGILTVNDSFDLTVIDVNNLPSFVLSGDLLLDEDFAGVRSVTVIPDPVSPDEAGQVVTYSIAPDPATITFAAINFDSATGQVDVTSISDLNGSQNFTITADDGQAVNNIYAQNFLLDVRAVNDPPVFTLSGDVELPEDFVGAVNVTVAPGPVPADETAQIIAYSISPPITFANISIDPATGLVTITSIPGEIGSQLMIVVAEDGQTENGSWGDSFTLTIGDPPPTAQKSANDQDADGLSDADEHLIGTDPLDPDSDADGIGDGLEVQFSSDPLTLNPYAAYIGSNPAGALVAHDSWDPTLMLMSGEPGLPTFVLMEQGRFPGDIRLADSCSHLVLVGSLAPGDYRSQTGRFGAPRTALSGSNNAVLSIDGCQDVRIANFSLDGGRNSGLQISNSDITASNLQIHHNTSSNHGGGVFVKDSTLLVIDSTIAANSAAGDGGGIYSENTLLDIRHSTISGNRATSAGAIASHASQSGSQMFNVLIAGNRAKSLAGLKYDSAVSLANVSAVDNAQYEPRVDNEIETAIIEAADNIADSVITGEAEQPYRYGYYLDRNDSMIDSGMISSELAGLADRYASTAAIPDHGPVDAGYHHARRYIAPDETLRVTATESPSVLWVTPYNGKRALGPGHRVRLIDDNGVAGAVFADLGDGRYAAHVSGLPASGFLLDIDGRSVRVVFDSGADR